MKNSIRKIKESNDGISFVIVLLIIAVFSVFIVGTYAVLNTHIIITHEDAQNQGAYYAAEGLVRLSSTQIDKLAYAIAEEATNNNIELTEDEFVEELNGRVYSTDFKALVEEAFDYPIEQLTVTAVSNPSTRYSCFYKILAVVDFNDNSLKKVTGTYGVIYTSSTGETTTYNTMTINSGSSMLVALDSIEAEEEASLNGKIELAGEFDYPWHYPFNGNTALYKNNGNYYHVGATSLNHGNVNIPSIPNPPALETVEIPEWNDKRPSNGSTNYIQKELDLPYTEGTIFNRRTYKYYEYDDYKITNYSGIFLHDRGALTLNVNEDDCYFLVKTLHWDNELMINANADRFILYVEDELDMMNGAKLNVNLNDNDVYIIINDYTSSTSGLIGSYRPDNVEVTTTGAGTLYIYINDFEQFDGIDFEVDITNESKVVIVFNTDFYIDSNSANTYDSMIFNAYTPAGKTKAGDLHVFVIDDPETGEEHYYKLYQNSTVTFNAAEGTNLCLIADNIYMQGKMLITGEAPLNMYARKTCILDGLPNNNNCLSNFADTDENLSENEKAEKIVNTRLNLYYYGTDDFVIKNYKACSNFYIANFADILITNSYFLGNIFSSAREPEMGETRRQIVFTNSYLSCGAIYSPRVDVAILGDDASLRTYRTDEGDYASCIFASITGTNIFMFGNTYAKNSSVTTLNLELVIEMEYLTNVSSNGESFVADHFVRGIKEVR